MALRGNLRDFALPDVFRLVALSGKTGVLRLRRSDAEGSVWFRGGQVFFAQSDVRRELLGQRLVAAGRLAPGALARSLDLRAEEPVGGRRLGEILVDEGLITFPLLEAFVQEQIQDTIFDLFVWDEGEFSFDLLEAAPEDQDIGLSVSIENIVMEGARRLEEWSKMRSTAPDSGIVYRLSAAPAEDSIDISLKPSEWRVLLYTDGTRTVADIAAAAGVSRLEAARTLHGLLGAGLLEVVDDEAPLPAPELEPEAEPAPAAGPGFEPEAETVPEPASAPAPAPEPEPEPAPAPIFRPQAPPRESTEYGVTSSNLWAGLGDELIALTGSRGTAPLRSAATSASAAGAAARVIHQDPAVSREAVEAVLRGIEDL